MITTIPEALTAVKDILDSVVPFLIGLSVLVVVWGIFKYIAHAAEEEKRVEAGKFILWGIVGIFIMISIWGLINVLGNTITFGDKTAPTDMPDLPPIP